MFTLNAIGVKMSDIQLNFEGFYMATVVLVTIVFFASVLQAATGFGFAIISIPFFLFIFGPHEAIQLNILLSIIICLIVSWRNRRKIERGLLTRLVWGSLVGVLPGAALFVFLDERPLKIFISVVILLSAALLLAQKGLKASPGKELTAGVFSGLLTASTGMGGPPLMIYFLGTKTDKTTIHAATNAYFVIVSIISFLLLFIARPLAAPIWTAGLLAIPFLLAGMLLGQWLFTKINQQLFLKIIYLLLIVSGLYMLLTNL